MVFQPQKSRRNKQSFALLERQFRQKFRRLLQVKMHYDQTA